MIKAAYAGIQKFFEENKGENEDKEEAERKETSQMPDAKSSSLNALSDSVKSPSEDRWMSDEKSPNSNAQNDSALSSRENIAQSEDEGKRNKKIEEGENENVDNDSTRVVAERAGRGNNQDAVGGNDENGESGGRIVPTEEKRQVLELLKTDESMKENLK